jgi:hypothetical protein
MQSLADVVSPVSPKHLVILLPYSPLYTVIVTTYIFIILTKVRSFNVQYLFQKNTIFQTI